MEPEFVTKTQGSCGSKEGKQKTKKVRHNKFSPQLSGGFPAVEAYLLLQCTGTASQVRTDAKDISLR